MAEELDEVSRIEYLNLQARLKKEMFRMNLRAPMKEPGKVFLIVWGLSPIMAAALVAMTMLIPV